MPKFNHAFDVAFEIISDKEDASDVTVPMVIDALRKRLLQFEANERECYEAVLTSKPFDTYEMEVWR